MASGKLPGRVRALRLHFVTNCEEQEELGAVTATRNDDSSAAFGTEASRPRQRHAVLETNAV